MARLIQGSNNRGGVGPLASLTSSTADETGTEYQLKEPFSKWGLQVKSTSTSLRVQLLLGLATSSDSSLTAATTWTSTSDAQADGDTIWTVDKPANIAAAKIAAGSTDLGVAAWITAVR